MLGAIEEISAAIRNERATTQPNPFQANPEGRWRFCQFFFVARFSRTDLSMIVARALKIMDSEFTMRVHPVPTIFQTLLLESTKASR
jgi:hypothetical protein